MNYPLPKPKGTVNLDISVNGVVALKLDTLAQDAGKSRKQYCNELFMAAYSVRVGTEKGDRELNAAVDGTLVHAHDGDHASLKQMLTALQENYRDLQARYEQARGYRDQSGEIMNLRRQAVDAKQEADKAAAEARKKIADLEKQVADLRAGETKAVRQMTGKVTALTIERDKLLEERAAALEASPPPVDDAELKTLREQILEMGKQVEDRDRVAKELDEAKEALTAQIAVADGARGACAALHEDITQLNTQIGTLRRDLNIAQASLGSKDSEIAVFKTRIAELNKRIEEHQRARLDLARELAEKDNELSVLRSNPLIQVTTDKFDGLRIAPQINSRPPELDALWTALRILQNDVLSLKEAPAPTVVNLDPHTEVASINPVAIRNIKGFAAAKIEVPVIASLTGVSEAAINIILNKKKIAAAE